MLDKIRTAILIVFAAFIGFIVAGFALVGMADDSPMIALTKTSPDLAIVWMVIQASAGLALLAVVTGGLPLAVMLIRRAVSGSHQGLGLLLAPVIAFVVLVGYVAIIMVVSLGRIQLPGVVPVVQTATFPPGNRVLLAGLMVTFVMGALVSTLAVWRVVSHTEIEQDTFRAFKREFTIRIYQFAFWPAVVTTVMMFVMLVATVVWGWLAFSALPGVLGGNFGPWGTSTLGWSIAILLVMAGSAGVAGLGVLRARSNQMPS